MKDRPIEIGCLLTNDNGCLWLIKTIWVMSSISYKKKESYELIIFSQLPESTWLLKVVTRC